MARKIYLVEETELVNTLTRTLKECCADDLATIAGFCLGGKCEFMCTGDLNKSRKYLFYPDENYGGVFNTPEDMYTLENVPNTIKKK